MKANVQLESDDLIVITETWWDESCDWNAVFDSYRLFRKDRRGRRGKWVALYIQKWIECEELTLKSSSLKIYR